MKQKQYCKKFNKDFKNGPHQKKKKLKKKARLQRGGSKEEVSSYTTDLGKRCRKNITL